MTLSDRLDDVEQWYFQNVVPFWVVTAVAAVLGALLFWGGSATISAIVDHPLDGCLTPNGLMHYDAPDRCYDPSTRPLSHRDVAAVNQPRKILAAPVYDPPCGPKSDEHFCAAPTISKSLIKGEIDTVTFNGDTPTVDDDHLQPDYTEVSYLPPGDDTEEQTEKFCGNVLDQFTPGKRFSMILQQSKMSDYNGCYQIAVTDITFGGKNIKTVRAPHATIPGGK